MFDFESLFEQWRDDVAAALTAHPVMSGIHVFGAGLTWIVAILGGTPGGLLLAFSATVVSLSALILVGRRINDGWR